MKTYKFSAVLLLILCCLASDMAWARGGGRYNGWRGYGYGHNFGGFGGGYGFRGGYRYGGRSGFGVFLGAPIYNYGFPYYNYGYPYFYSPPPTVVTIPTPAPIYIQQTPMVTRPNGTAYWYYCTNPEGYYPSVKNCPNGWQKVAPTPPPR